MIQKPELNFQILMEKSELDLDEFVRAVKSVSDYDFSEYSDKSLKRRVERLLEENKVSIQNLILKLKTDANFLEQIVRDITVNTTELFRDPEVWQEIRHRILNALKDKTSINIWHAGCSTGQEVYSLEILLKEMGLLEKCNIYASDLNADVLESAYKAEYNYRFNLSYCSNFDQVIKENSGNITEGNDRDINAYFIIDKKKDRMIAKDFLRTKPVFKKMDLVKLENIFNTQFDIIFCRNVLIYFNLNLQNKVIDFFHQNLSNNGVLILGKHESLLGYTEKKFEKKGKFYRKRE